MARAPARILRASASGFILSTRLRFVLVVVFPALSWVFKCVVCLIQLSELVLIYVLRDSTYELEIRGCIWSVQVFVWMPYPSKTPESSLDVVLIG